jgi:hypothetical protein
MRSPVCARHAGRGSFNIAEPNIRQTSNDSRLTLQDGTGLPVDYDEA